MPLALAAVLLPGAWATVIAATTIGTALLTEVLISADGLTPLEAVELTAFGLVALGLRIAVARLVLARETLDRQTTELASVQAQVLSRGPRRHRALGRPAGGRAAGRVPDERAADRGSGRRGDHR